MIRPQTFNKCGYLGQANIDCKKNTEKLELTMCVVIGNLLTCRAVASSDDIPPCHNSISQFSLMRLYIPARFTIEVNYCYSNR